MWTKTIIRRQDGGVSMKSFKRGFTLIELLVAIVVASIVVAVAYNILYTGVKGFGSSRDSFEKQSDIRYAMEVTNNAIKYATAGFAVTKDDFKPTLGGGGQITGIVKPWNYIGLSPTKDAIWHYIYVDDGAAGKYDIKVLAQGAAGTTYDLKFEKKTHAQDDKVIDYQLVVEKNGSKEVLSTALEAINALHIIDWGDNKNPAIAIAYRTDATPEISRKPIAALSMVLDTSGSMSWAMNGYGTTITTTNPRRISLLKETLNDEDEGLFQVLSQSDVFVSLVPFSYTANIPNANYGYVSGIDKSKFFKVVNEKSSLVTLVNALNTGGGTNTGDGIRRAYYQLKTFNDNKSYYGVSSTVPVKNYMVVLVDGVTTIGSAAIDIEPYGWGYIGYFRNFVTHANDIGTTFYSTRTNSTNYMSPYTRLTGDTVERPVGNGSVLDPDYGTPYVDLVGDLIKKSTTPVDQCFVIGYSNVRDAYGNYPELENLADVAEAIGIPVTSQDASEKFVNNDFVFIATDKESLKKAFDDIGGYINESLWQVEGPKLTP